MPRPTREIVRKLTSPSSGRHYEFERIGNRYKLWFHGANGELVKMPISADILRELGSAMLVEGASNDYRR